MLFYKIFLIYFFYLCIYLFIYINFTCSRNESRIHMKFKVENLLQNVTKVIQDNLMYLENERLVVRMFHMDLQVKSSINFKFTNNKEFIDTQQLQTIYIFNCAWQLLFIDIFFVYSIVLFIERMEISEKMPIVEGTPLLLACIVHGASDMKVKWSKDNSPIVFPAIHGRLWNSTIPRNSYDSYTFLLGIDKSHFLDSGRKRGISRIFIENVLCFVTV